MQRELNETEKRLINADTDPAAAYELGRVDGAAAEREAIIAIVAKHYPSETQYAMVALARINYDIRQRGEQTNG